jgi:amino acid transporter
VVLFCNSGLPLLQKIGLFLILGGCFITIVVTAAMPDQHATSDSVWREWINSTGYGSDGFVFLMGMLNGAYAVGTPDCVTHLAEEIPNPRVNIPKAIGAQMVTGLFTAFFYLVAILYSVNDMDALLNNPYTFPLAELYLQATGTRAGSMGLLIVIFLPTVCTLIGCYITSGRMLWTLARDDATPFAAWTGRISKRWKNPFNATLVCGVICTILGAIYVGSFYAFNAFVGSFIVLSTLSYLAAIMPHYINRKQYAAPGPFAIKGVFGYILAAIASSYILAFAVIFCFPYAMPVDDVTMNYTCVTTGGFTIFTGAWYLWKRSHGYVGPKILLGAEGEAAEQQRKGSVSA